MSVVIRSAMLGLFAVTNVAAFAEEVVKEIDLRSEEGKKTENAYFVVFNAYQANAFKGSFGGHAYVGFGKDDSVAELCTYSAYGLYPKKGIGWVGPVPANMVTDTWKKSDFRLIVRVDQKTFEDLEGFKKDYVGENEAGEYELGKRDCVTFTSEIAKRLDLKIPDRKDALFPSTFLELLIEANE